MAKANADAAAANAQTNGSVPVSQAQDVRSSPQVPNQGLKKPVEIRLDDATEADGEGEEEIEHVREGEEEEVEYEEEYEEEEEEDLEVSSTFGEYGGERGSYSPSSFSRVTTPEVVLDGEDDPESDPPEGHFQKRRSQAESNSDDESEPLPPARRPRKRSCDELEDEDVQELRRKKEGTPPKRARKGDGTMDPRPAATLAVGGRTNRMRKRNSEELRDDDDTLGDAITRGESTIRTNAARRERGNTNSDERSGDTTSPHKRLKMGDAGRDRDHRGRDGGGKSRVLR
jgi:hypothetical protein